MSELKPFLPLDKPKSWVVAVCTGLIGMAVGLVGFTAGMFGVKPIQAIAGVLFMLCWLVVVTFMLFFAIRLFNGYYINIQPKKWHEQIW